jgi:CBS domain containing-hemolysin-like protein
VNAKPPFPARSAPLLRRIAACVALAAATSADASLFKGEALDNFADALSWAVLILVPIVLITVFWLVHVLPEKIAHKRHHPQTQAIQTLCLLSLVFGGMLWPIAWLWAYTRPVAYKVAYGTDKHEDFYAEALQKLRNGELSAEERAALQRELDVIDARGGLPPDLVTLRDAIGRDEVDAQPVATNASRGA